MAGFNASILCPVISKYMPSTSESQNGLARSATPETKRVLTTHLPKSLFI